MNLLRYSLEKIAQKTAGGRCSCLLMKFDESELRDAVDGDEHVQLALLSAHFGDIDMEIANRIGLELLLLRLLTLDIHKAADAMTLQASMQRRPRDGFARSAGPARTALHH